MRICNVFKCSVSLQFTPQILRFCLKFIYFIHSLICFALFVKTRWSYYRINGQRRCRYGFLAADVKRSKTRVNPLSVSPRLTGAWGWDARVLAVRSRLWPQFISSAGISSQVSCVIARREEKIKACTAACSGLLYSIFLSVTWSIAAKKIFMMPTAIMLFLCTIKSFPIDFLFHPHTLCYDNIFLSAI